MDFIISIAFFFMLYSFMGWLIEGLFNLFTKGTFVKDGFLLGPFKPMYGFAMTSLALFQPYVPWYLFLIGTLIIPTTIEYVTGFIMFHYFNTKYWDYSSIPFNYKGHICIPFSAAWILLSFIGIYFIHPLVTIFYTSWQSLWYIITPIFSIYLFLDFVFTLQNKLTTTFSHK